MTFYIVTEGNTDADLLRNVLSAVELPPFHITSAGGRSSALPFAKSIITSRQSPVAVVLDSDSLDPERTREQERMYSDLLRAASSKVPFRVFLAEPSIERVLFDDSDALSELLGVPISDRTIEEAQFRPQEVLDELLEQSGKFRNKANLFSNINPRAAKSFAEVPFFRSMIEFIRHPAPLMAAHMLAESSANVE